MIRADTSVPLLTTDLPLPGRRAGKVRDIYDCVTTDGRPAVLLIATDRISAFDVVMPTPIPGKGAVLTGTAAFWFAQITQHLGERVGHHLISTDIADVAGLDEVQRAPLAGRVMVGRRARVVPIECVVRGYLAGSGWKEYRQTGRVCGVQLPPGLQQGAKLPEPIFTPSTKADEGHDENITFEQACDTVGGELMETLRRHSFAVYALGHAHAAARGIILADTKLEFGLPEEDAPGASGGGPCGGETSGDGVMLIDEVMTPDSSRFWPADSYRVGRDQPSFDKQFVRDYLESLVAAGRWNKESPGPALPAEVVDQTAAKYREAMRRLTGPATGACDAAASQR